MAQIPPENVAPFAWWWSAFVVSEQTGTCRDTGRQACGQDKYELIYFGPANTSGKASCNVTPTTVRLTETCCKLLPLLFILLRKRRTALL
jgi:hypothetical protein